jgi:iron complex transport system substrate-binding protein
MRRSSILWLVVVIGAGGTIAIRFAGPRITESVAPMPGNAPGAVALPSLRDYVADPVVDPAERGNGPARIISLAPSITETCCALGLIDRLVGRTQYCVHPPALRERKIPSVGALVDANLELIVSLKPQVIFISKNAPRLRDQLSPLKLRFEEITDDSFAGIFRGIKRVGEISDRRVTAATLIGNLQRDLAAIDMAARTRRPQRVLIVEGSLPVPPQSVFVAGPGLFLTDLLECLGHRNAADGVVTTKSGELSLEQIVTINPDVILEARPDSTAAAMEGVYAAWSQIGAVRAIRNRAVRSYGTYDDLVPSPRVNIVYDQLARAMADWR